MSNPSNDIAFLVEEVGLLQRGRIALVGINRGQPIKSGMRGIVATPEGGMTVEVLSIGIVDPRSQNPNKKLLQVRVSGGDPKSLKSHTLHFK